MDKLENKKRRSYCYGYRLAVAQAVVRVLGNKYPDIDFKIHVQDVEIEVKINKGFFITKVSAYKHTLKTVEENIIFFSDDQCKRRKRKKPAVTVA
jgi:hypothetical protein